MESTGNKETNEFNSMRPLPDENITIKDEFSHVNFDDLAKKIKKVEYFRLLPNPYNIPEDSWLVKWDLMTGGAILLYYPSEMSDERFEEFMHPLVKKIKEINE